MHHSSGKKKQKPTDGDVTDPMGKKKKKEERDESFWKLEYAERADSFWKLDDAERKVQKGSLTPRQYGIYLDLRAENTGQPSTSTTAAQFVAIAVPEKDAAVATPVAVAVAAPEKAAAIATPTAAQAVAIAAPEEAAAVATPVAIAALEKAAAIATHSGSEDKQTVTDIAAETATAIASPEGEIRHLQLRLTAQQAATVAAITAAEEATAAAASMDVENRRGRTIPSAIRSTTTQL